MNPDDVDARLRDRPPERCIECDEIIAPGDAHSGPDGDVCAECCPFLDCTLLRAGGWS